MKFEQLIESQAILKAIEDLSWREPTPIQRRAIPPMKEGKDVVGIAQTGTGKTAAFLMPALERLTEERDFQMLVVCPTRELAHQVAADARDLSRHMDAHVVEVYGGVRMGPQIKQLKKGFDILVATPGRLIDHLERGNTSLDGVKLLVLDEADRMLDMGFRPQIDAIIRRVPRVRQTFLVSATMPNGVHALALRILNDPIWVEADPSATAAENVEQIVYPVKSDKKADLMLALLEDEDLDQVLVFTRTKRGADVLHARLRRAGIEAAVLHGDRNMKERRRALDLFAEGHARVLVATDVAQRGLDIEGISHVVNYDVPQDPEEYIHRIGRTGRAGASGTAVTFMSGGELGLVHAIEYALGEKLPRVSEEGFDFTGGQRGGMGRKVRSNRTGRRMGSRSTDELSEEELQKLLKLS